MKLPVASTAAAITILLFKKLICFVPFKNTQLCPAPRKIVFDPGS
jgi:hypothetical protein